MCRYTFSIDAITFLFYNDSFETQFLSYQPLAAVPPFGGGCRVGRDRSVAHGLFLVKVFK